VIPWESTGLRILKVVLLAAEPSFSMTPNVIDTAVYPIAGHIELLALAGADNLGYTSPT